MHLIQKTSIDLLKYPLITEKTIQLFEKRQYSFIVVPQANKTSIKIAIETLFDVKVISVNTSLQSIKKRRRGKFIVKKPQYKRAIVRLMSKDVISFFEDG